MGTQSDNVSGWMEIGEYVKREQVFHIKLKLEQYQSYHGKPLKICC